MTTYRVSNAAELAAAIAAARGGDLIELGSGNYGNVRIKGVYDSLVTIQSAPGASAHFDRMALWQSANIAIRNIDIGSPRSASEPVWTRMVELNDSRNITLDGLRIHGSLDNNPLNDGWGALIRNIDGLTIKNSEFTELARGFIMERSRDVLIDRNIFHNMESEGANFTAVTNVRITDNQFTNFKPRPDAHPDAIQFWTSGQTTGSSNIYISGNVILQGNGVGTQGIFLRDEVGTLPYKNVVIENNVLYGADQWHGISVEHAVGVVIRNNSVLSPSLDSKQFRIAVKKVVDGEIYGNVADQILNIGDANSVNIRDNLDLSIEPQKRSLIPGLNLGASAGADDLLVSGIGYVAANAGSPAPKPPSIEPTSRILYGTNASDSLVGTAADDRIFGFSQSDATLGRSTIDRLTGGEGRDTFVLGDARGLFYDDGNAWRAGRGDYAQVLDFKAGVDKVQLAGSFGDYVFRVNSINGQKGLEILRDVNNNDRYDSRDELIGHIVGVTTVNPEHFVFG